MKSAPSHAYQEVMAGAKHHSNAARCRGANAGSTRPVKTADPGHCDSAAKRGNNRHQSRNSTHPDSETIPTASRGLRKRNHASRWWCTWSVHLLFQREYRQSHKIERFFSKSKMNYQAWNSWMQRNCGSIPHLPNQIKCPTGRKDPRPRRKPPTAM